MNRATWNGKHIHKVTTETLGGAFRHAPQLVATRAWWRQRNAALKRELTMRREELARRIRALLRRRSPQTCAELAEKLGVTQHALGRACRLCDDIDGEIPTAGNRLKRYSLTCKRDKVNTLS